MFELTETIDIEQNTNILKKSELVKGGFPRIKVCDEDFLRKLNERKPREFSSDKIISIKHLLEKKKTQIEDPFNSMGETLNVIMTGGENNIINGISIDAIIGKK